MRLEKASTYGLLALITLAKREASQPARVHDIARSTGVPIEYLRKLLRRLLQAQLIRSVRGRHGGYLLARPLERISVLHVIEAIEGPIDRNTIIDDASLSRALDEAMGQLPQWRLDAADRVRDLFSQTCLQDLVEV